MVTARLVCFKIVRKGMEIGMCAYDSMLAIHVNLAPGIRRKSIDEEVNNLNHEDFNSTKLHFPLP